MEKYTKEKMNRLGIDSGMQPLVGLLCNGHSYKTMYSCEGHAPELQDHYVGNERVTTLNPNTRYISIEKGTGDGWLEKHANELGLTDRYDSDLTNAKGKRVHAISFYAGNPTAEHLSDKQANAYRRAA